MVFKNACFFVFKYNTNFQSDLKLSEFDQTTKITKDFLNTCVQLNK